MADISWPGSLNTKVYGMESGWVDNREKLEYKSGRSVYYLKNSTPRKRHPIMMKFDDSKPLPGSSLTEWKYFQNWFENTIKSGALPFLFPDLSNKGTGTRLYYMDEIGDGKGQREKKISFTLEEA